MIIGKWRKINKKHKKTKLCGFLTEFMFIWLTLVKKSDNVIPTKLDEVRYLVTMASKHFYIEPLEASLDWEK